MQNSGINSGINFDELNIDGIIDAPSSQEDEQRLHALALEMEMPIIDLKNHAFNVDCVNMIPEKIARRHNVILVNYNEHGKLILAVSDPQNISAIHDIKMLVNQDIYVSLAKKREISDAISKYYDRSSAASKAAEEFIAVEGGLTSKEETEEVTESPIVRLVDSIIVNAASAKASDIHIEPFEHEMRVRYRVDGILKDALNLNINMHSPITIRVKIMAGIDISEKRKPQDGGIEMFVKGRNIDIRVSVLPTVYGEKIVMRLLDRSAVLLERDKLGFSKINNDRFDQILSASEGIVLLTGPTGSGKTTTLYTVLSELNSTESNLITVEDPVEYRMDGINQVQVNTRAGLTFASGLRSILRQDPDIVMVGEIRDEETAQIAFRAAITGHLVLSTLHTNDTVSTLTRLIDMNVPPYMVSTAVNGVVAQRLIRKLCDNCKTKQITSPAEMKKLKIDSPIEIYQPVGCKECENTGYKGRMAVHEVLIMTREIRNLIAAGKSVDEIKDFARKDGMLTLEDSCIHLIKEGITTINQMDRLVYDVDM